MRVSIALMVMLLVGCDTSIEGKQTYPSPDGSRIVAVVTVLHAADDPAPWRTHVSVRKPPEESAQVSANVARLEGRGAVNVKWHSPTEVEVRVSKDLQQLNQLPLEKKVGDVAVRIVPE